MSEQDDIQAFLRGGPHAVVGAARDRAKYGNKVLRAFLQHQRPVYAVNPSTDEVEGQPSYPDLASLPEPVFGVCIITPPQVTAQIIEQADALGIEYLWLQPGAENPAIMARAVDLGLNVIAGGPCILVALGFHE